MLRKAALLVLVLSACTAERETIKAGVPEQASPVPVATAAPAAVPVPSAPVGKDPNEPSLPELKFKEPPPLTAVEVTRDPTTLPAPLPRSTPAPASPASPAKPAKPASASAVRAGEPTPDLTPQQLAALMHVLPADNGQLVKLNERGGALAATAKAWACVRDAKTGLVWEAKTANGERNRDFTYSVIGAAGACGQKACGVDGYVQTLNKTALCGIKKWRLPKRHELLGVVSATLADPHPKIDVRYFSNVRRGYYWSATEFQFNPHRMWTVNFSTGQDNSRDKAEPAYLMLVADQ